MVSELVALPTLMVIAWVNGWLVEVLHSLSFMLSSQIKKFSLSWTVLKDDSKSYRGPRAYHELGSVLHMHRFSQASKRSQG